ncbi:MAG TPA: hypothetical protein VGI81_02050 [Tepidisphaeraceae bacterium]|jgi:hypothetical protein
MSNVAGSEIQVIGMSTAQDTALAALRAGRSFRRAAERKEARVAGDATVGANSGDAPQVATGDAAPVEERKLRPEREMGQSAGAAGADPAAATGRATGEAVSHGQAVQAKSQ